MTKEQIEKILMNMGIYPYHVGFKYLVEAIPLAFETLGKSSFAMYIYCEVGEKCGVDYRCVERGIRESLKNIKRDTSDFKKYIGIDESEKITTKKFLSMFAYNSLKERGERIERDTNNGNGDG